jgi:hypothetical protein
MAVKAALYFGCLNASATRFTSDMVRLDIIDYAAIRKMNEILSKIKFIFFLGQ